MPAQNFGYRELLQLVELIESSSHFREFRFRSGNLEIELRRGDAGQSPRLNGATAPLVEPAAAATGPTPVAPAPSPTTAALPRSDAPPTPRGGADAGIANKAGTGAASPEPFDGVVVRSPMVGSFYRAPEPGAAPFVEIGQVVEADTTVCIIEVMKLMNSLPATCRGTVVQILVADGEAVEYGQPLIVVRPA